MKHYPFTMATIVALLSFFGGSAQNIGIGTATPNASAMLDVSAPDKGLLIPRVNLTATNSNAPIGAWVQGLLVYNLVNAGAAPYNVVANQFYYSNGSQWVAIGSGWGLTGNAGASDAINFIGTTDDQPFNIRVKNQKAGRIDSALANTFFGYRAGDANTIGSTNSASGFKALYSNIDGNYNTASGANALYSNTTGYSNTASGEGALRSNTTGFHNTASGASALSSNTTGNNNTACGVLTLGSNTTGNYNTASGANALFSNIDGNYNTASGANALYYNTTGYSNTASGEGALRSNTIGFHNTASGASALSSNTTGNNNTASGVNALYSNTAGIDNTASGYRALYYNTTGFQNIAVGRDALYYNTTGEQNTALGSYAGYGTKGVNFNECTFIGFGSYPAVARTNVTMLGAFITNAQCTGDNQVLLGNTAITQIRAQVGSITTYSDARFKVNVKDNVKGLDFIMRLQPVSYQQDPAKLQQIWNPTGYLQASNPDYTEIRKKRFIGFLAQDVEKAAMASGFDFPGIDVPQTDKDVYTLRYVDFIMPMVKAMQEQQWMIQTLKKENETLRSDLEKIKALLKL